VSILLRQAIEENAPRAEKTTALGWQTAKLAKAACFRQLLASAVALSA
jgi:hypothetical protein